MFMKILKKKKNNKNGNPLNGICKTSNCTVKMTDKSVYYENIAQSINLIELEKEMQSRLDLLV